MYESEEGKTYLETQNKLRNLTKRLRSRKRAIASKKHKKRLKQINQLDKNGIVVCSKFHYSDCTEIALSDCEQICSGPLLCSVEIHEIVQFDPLEIFAPNFDPDWLHTVIEYTEEKVNELTIIYNSALNLCKEISKGFKLFEYLELKSIRKIYNYYILKSSLFDSYINKSINLLIIKIINYNEEKLFNKRRIISNIN